MKSDVITEAQARERILAGIQVNRPDVAAAKAYVVKYGADGGHGNTEAVVDSWVRHNGVTYPDPVVLRGDAVAEDLHRIARALSLRLAAYTAIWELVSTAALYPVGATNIFTPTIQWTTTTSTTGGRSAGLLLGEITHPYPAQLYWPVLAPGHLYGSGDLYLQRLELPELHAGIAEALQEAVQCFRFELFTGAVATLGAAMEGMWAEVGMALVESCPQGSKVEKIRRIVDDPRRGIGQLTKAVRELCEDKAASAAILEAAAVRQQDLRAAALWSDEVRDSRNVLHWGVEPSLANTYDKVATLFLTSSRHLRTLWALRNAAISKPR